MRPRDNGAARHDRAARSIYKVLGENTGEWRFGFGAKGNSLANNNKFDKAVNALRAGDRDLARVIDRVGPCGLVAQPDGFHALLRAIVAQQVSKHAAASIFARLLALFPSDRPDPHALLALPHEALMGCGLSRRKVDYARDLSAHVADGRLDFDRLCELPDEEVIEILVAVKGIGRWTAQMYLLFSLNRLDVFPIDDLAVVTAMRDVYGLSKRARPARLMRIAESWRPYRSVASWYLYRQLEHIRQRERAATEAARAATKPAKRRKARPAQVAEAIGG